MTVDKSLSTAKPSRSLWGSSWFAKAAIALCLILLLVGAIPRYLQGSPPIDPIPDAPIASLQTLRDQGLTLDNWTSVDLQNIQLGPNRWVMQTLSWDGPEPPEGQTDRATLLMSPQRVQTGTSAQPQMEWIDVRGLGRAQGERWTEDQHQQLRFTVTPESGRSTEIQARYFRGRTERRSFAIVQWYAWENGGNPSLVRWFWRDRMARLQNRRLPWVAVSLIVPIEHLSQVDDASPFLETFAQQVHTALLEQGFNTTSTPD
ncbi:cyanoexosortase B system-associated protein [Sodalinema gerasimenkoae]|uniref:cyanoexosortase B system-associated protein n=1 Tax=Sodalinema gerasimenkoae TaxID=2862348 RepID=UPI00135BDA57|nr:cyanoexosortase B system-associated protein [Sodalinema gerasimenkoae]